MANGSPIFNGERVFLDINGDPLSGGSVFFYAPGTTDPSTTWADQPLTVANPNPVILDQAGRAIIWGDGLYRQVVQDQFGNVQWDRETSAGLSTSLTSLSVNNLTVTGTITTNVANITSANITNANIGSATISNFSVGGPIQAVSGALVVNNGLVVNHAPGQLDAMLLNGDLEIDGSDNGKTYFTGRRVSTQSNDTPGFVMENTQDAVIWGMWNGDGHVYWGPADSSTPGNPISKLMFLDGFGNLTIADTYLTSDENLKRDLQPLNEDCMEIVSKATTRRYKIGQDDKEHWGFTAQDLSSVTSGAIGSDGTVSISGLVAILWKALQESNHRLLSLQETVREQGVQLANLDKKRRNTK